MEKLPLGVFHVMIKYFFHTALSSVFFHFYSLCSICFKPCLIISQWETAVRWGLSIKWLKNQLEQIVVPQKERTNLMSLRLKKIIIKSGEGAFSCGISASGFWSHPRSHFPSHGPERSPQITVCEPSHLWLFFLKNGFYIFKGWLKISTKNMLPGL